MLEIALDIPTVRGPLLLARMAHQQLDVLFAIINFVVDISAGQHVLQLESIHVLFVTCQHLLMEATCVLPMLLRILLTVTVPIILNVTEPHQMLLILCVVHGHLR